MIEETTKIILNPENSQGTKALDKLEKDCLNYSEDYFNTIKAELEKFNTKEEMAQYLSSELAKILKEKLHDYQVKSNHYIFLFQLIGSNHATI